MFAIGDQRLGSFHVNPDHLPRAVGTAVNLFFRASQPLVGWTDARCLPMLNRSARSRVSHELPCRNVLLPDIQVKVLCFGACQGSCRLSHAALS